MRDITVEQIDQICIDYRRMRPPQPLSLIAQLNGVTVETVRRVLTAQGYPVAARRTRVDEGISAQIREMAGQGLTWVQAAKRLGLSVERTKNAARLIGLDGPEDFQTLDRQEQLCWEEKVRSLCGQGLKIEEAAAKLGMKKSTFRGRVQRLGLIEEFDTRAARSRENTRDEKEEAEMLELLRSCGLFRGGAQNGENVL